MIIDNSLFQYLFRFEELKKSYIYFKFKRLMQEICIR